MFLQMAASRSGVPIMWLCALLVVRAARDFPELVNVMFDICGTEKFDLTPASPCHFKLFGLALAWQECAEAHLTNMEGFKMCLNGCVAHSTCSDICGTPTNVSRCHAECDVVMSCTQRSLTDATGQVSAESAVRDCFHGGNSAALQAAARRTAAAWGTQAQLVASWKEHLSSTAASLRQLRPPAASMSQLRSVATHEVVPGAVAAEGECACDTSGSVRGVATKQSGCRRHGQEPMAEDQWYCYIAGDTKCPGAMPSRTLSGLFWVGCAGSFDYFPQLFPAGCQLLKYGFSPQEQPIRMPSEPKGHGAIEVGQLAPSQPRFAAVIKESVQRILAAAVELPKEWHAQHAGVFLKPRNTAPEAGPSIPQALDTPLWWELAQSQARVGSEDTSEAPRATRPKKMPNQDNGGFW